MKERERVGENSPFPQHHPQLLHTIPDGILAMVGSTEGWDPWDKELTFNDWVAGPVAMLIGVSRGREREGDWMQAEQFQFREKSR